MKKIAPLVLGACVYSSFASATDNVDLNIKGVLTNAACVPSLSNGGVVDFGHIPLGSLNKGTTNQLGHRTITLTITCDSAMPVGFITSDNRADSLEVLSLVDAKGEGYPVSAQSDPGFEYGLGKTAAGVKLGAYTFSMSSTPTADGEVKDLIFTKADKNGAWLLDGSGSAQVSTRLHSMADVGTLIPVAYKVGVYPIKVTAAIQGTDILGITDDTDLDGLATISLYYM